MQPYRQNNRILYVDDEAGLLSSFTSLLRTEDVDPLVLQDSTQIEDVLAREGPFAVVFSDQRMPGLDGVATLEAVARTHPSTIRVMITGYADHGDMSRAINIAGISSYVPKPWKDDALRRMIRESIMRYNLLEEKAHVSLSLAASHRSLEELLDQMIARDELTREKAAKTFKAMLREKELMLKEIHHRVKNNMQVISGILSMQSRMIGDASSRIPFEKVGGRIRAMAMVHEALYVSKDLGSIDFLGYLRAHVAEARSHTSPHRIQCTVQGEPVMLGIDAAVPLGLITHELVTNALTHAFVGRAHGSLCVSVKKLHGRTIEVCIEDDGVGLPAQLSRNLSDTLGLTLVDILVSQLGATLQTTVANGTRFVIHMTLPGENAI
jgi:two-component sensor histidine kinase/ActR/RegA family two-component response regulator